MYSLKRLVVYQCSGLSHKAIVHQISCTDLITISVTSDVVHINYQFH
jgi:hypothetical protein